MDNLIYSPSPKTALTNGNKKIGPVEAY